MKYFKGVAFLFALTLAQASAWGQVSTVYAWRNFAGQPGGRGNVDGVGSAARFNGPNCVAVDSAGNVYVADTDNHSIRKVTSTRVVTTIGGMAGVVGGAEGVGSSVNFADPNGIAVDIAGCIYVADTWNNASAKARRSLS